MTSARLPCPVCIGVKLEKARFGSNARGLVLDHCRRCGGVWFERGEVQVLRRVQPDALWQQVPQRTEQARAKCHHCAAFIDRDAERCAACGESNRINCPACARQLERATHAGVTLDVCRHCQGVWFDHAELATLWKLELATASSRRNLPARASDGMQDAGDVLLGTLFWAPDLVFYGAWAGVEVAGAALGGLSHAPEAAGGAVEAIGEAAGGLFETIVEIIGGLFG